MTNDDDKENHISTYEEDQHTRITLNSCEIGDFDDGKASTMGMTAATPASSMVRLHIIMR
jgi:hypothetical protein